jgi:phage tail-like protein
VRRVLAANKFWVVLGNVMVAEFSECSGLTIETEVYEYAEGGSNRSTLKLPGRTKYTNVTLRRGMDPSQDLYTWFMQSVDGLPAKRRNVTIQLFEPGNPEPVKTWELVDAFPVKWTAPDLKTDTSAAAVETLEFAHHGIIQRGGPKGKR